MKKNSQLILIVEDEPDIRELLQYHLRKEGFNTQTAKNGEIAISLAREINPDLILLDLLLPGIKGLEVCRIIKNDKSTNKIKIIMVTALGQEKDIVKGLESGADDYISKPFKVKVLLARVNAVIRRNKMIDNQEDLTVDINNLHIQPITRTVKANGKPVLDLTFTEFQILHLLATHPGWVFTRYQIIDKIRGDNYPVTDRSVDFQIVGLRKKLGEYGKLIETIRSVGYRFHPNET